MSVKADPFSAPANFRAWVYEAIILQLETERVRYVDKRYHKATLKKVIGLTVEMRKNLPDVQSLENEQGFGCSEEFLVFYNDKGTGHECLFKRLRDAFAHGDYGSPSLKWVEIKHRFKGRNDKVELTRIFGRLKIQTLKNLVAYIDTSS
ncbi:MAG: hypothetical protein ABL920_06340 [Methylotenera sp.]|nr:hypothetical protein [Methylotenera sp.]